MKMLLRNWNSTQEYNNSHLPNLTGGTRYSEYSLLYSPSNLYQLNEDIHHSLSLTNHKQASYPVPIPHHPNKRQRSQTGDSPDSGLSIFEIPLLSDLQYRKKYLGLGIRVKHRSLDDLIVRPMSDERTRIARVQDEKIKHGLIGLISISILKIDLTR
ncbi:uncharacterized protein LY89DRAFT_402733 [Mollisia scopiformis]|uniref:Uncharacterized protein n=1 Tax=Mollisia scopiformis TaxID=149040 RepID=A0A132B2P3_MOLSC|nr:uncharacterized protein LY89DRAFT_402733 [Mollisia scopiformis]KUJ06662.1 hypothetical protein LY89DRAFT_402733 [Mollisia scopiformis]